MRRFAIVVSLIVVSLVAFVFVAVGPVLVKLLWAGDNQIALLNRAGEAIAHGELRAYGQTYGFQRTAVGETASVAFPVRGEGGYSIDVVFESGRKLSSTEIGYLSLRAMSDLVEIQDDKIVLVKRKVITKPEARSGQ